ncbi:putative Zn-dependent peptidase [Dehalogenimonas formicexedens]|uniref:Putative Zn-dependent peptidase n=1 Tax=Dehalogenimonas formicexedens TaxID=1839801 RepID=A0A1P8FAF4_9CHLR|nr:pitrilysin family protein [Dehalogenimonas formicexedens]APV45433.1 putative Zn-dependent peptidase [Dehalogenimonas formicexedens]
MYRKTVLPNGLRLLSQEMPHTLSVSVCIFVGTGSRYELEPVSGISHFIEHCLFRGTEKRPTSRAISESIEGIGGILNEGTDRETTVYWAKAPRDHFVSTLDTLSDMLLHSKFDPSDIEKERQVIVEEIHMSEDQPDQKACQLIDTVLWPGHPLGRDIAGTEKSVGAITRDDMGTYMAEHYLPENTVVAIAGGVSEKDIVASIEQKLGNWQPGSRKTPPFSPFTGADGRRLVLETRDIEQDHFLLALPALSIADPRRYTESLLNVILGEGMSSRLFSEIRDKLGLAYAIHSYAEFLKDTGAVTVAASVDPDNLLKALEAVIKELNLLKTTLTAQELAKAKELSKGRLALRLEDSRHVASWLGGQEILTGEVLTPQDVIRRIEAVTLDDLRDLADELIREDKMRLSLVGPVADEKPFNHLIGAG